MRMHHLLSRITFPFVSVSVLPFAAKLGVPGGVTVFGTSSMFGVALSLPMSLSMLSLSVSLGCLEVFSSCALSVTPGSTG